MSCLSIFTLSLGLSILLLLLLLLPPPVSRILYDRFLLFICAICDSVNRITDGNGRRPKLAGMGKRWPSRSDWLFVMIPICAWIPDHFFRFLQHQGIGDFRTFVSISLFSEFSYNQQPICTTLGEMTDVDEIMHPQFWDGYDGHPDSD